MHLSQTMLAALERMPCTVHDVYRSTLLALIRKRLVRLDRAEEVYHRTDTGNAALKRAGR